jgi:hypothetical protein
MRPYREVRCTCARRPLLALIGRDDDAKLFVWTKVYKGSRLYHEAVLHDGDISLRCRECMTWHRARLVFGVFSIAPEALPASIGL